MAKFPYVSGPRTDATLRCLRSLSCSLVSLDAMDVSGHSHGDVVNNIFKKRLDEDGKPFEQTIKNEVPVLRLHDSLLWLQCMIVKHWHCCGSGGAMS